MTSTIQGADAPGQDLKKKDLTLWVIQDHICRKCFGRVVSHQDDSQTHWKCTNCGYTVTGGDVSVICCCGIRYKKGGRKGSKSVAPVDAGIRCIRNPNITTEFCCEIVASEVAHGAR
ncbi:hypothetical protein F2264_21760 [Salmonella enterica]|nr:hypothetical protein [Salmonella enterica]EAR6391597.1 hypothetical protein [Salmonella enterica]ECC2206781.1 hypothetical protein [Salmonella enterica]ECU5200794.1 hypothetical protein [Salmonella enterica]